ncbi:helix-turn-helix domain-containing protein [Paractinoplanes durhamensis]|uniref:Transcriptional regulator n=1 Tax=Paractinoplanes durhamensis TaxID=113563 RepID=A0ABQ3Z0M5_9ACTN|nr:helix-turn-helix transcriptional regulator [Actinoplanes durhamensis]GIE03395.1 transcriptional regulator [Actinoplanes durhamensis]
MTRPKSPTVLRLQLGALLRIHREAKGLTVTQAAEALEINPSQVSRIETAKRQPTVMYVKALCHLYELDDDLTEQLLVMARQSREDGWWQQYGFGPAMSTYAGLEAAAVTATTFEPTVFPALLQTAAYAEALFRSGSGYGPDEIRRQVAFRLARQGVLHHQDPLRLHAIVDESALHRHVGGPDIMRAQLEQTARLAALFNVTVQILPFTAAPGIALGGAFSVLRFGEATMDDVVHIDGPLGAIFQAKKDDVQRCEQLFADLSRLALDETQSLQLIRNWITRLI